MKKLLSLLIALCVFASSAAIIGCGDDKGKDKDKDKKSTTTTTDKKADGK